MELRINFEKKHLWMMAIIAVIGVALVAAIVVNAQGNTKPNPGHSASEIGGTLLTDSNNDGIIDKANSLVPGSEGIKYCQCTVTYGIPGGTGVYTDRMIVPNTWDVDDCTALMSGSCSIHTLS